jgi:AbrB family looped-hinge helix DNA binding protein
MKRNEEPKAKRWTVPVDEEGVLTLPNEILDELGWKEGDNLEWLDQEDGSLILVKVEETN